MTMATTVSYTIPYLRKLGYEAAQVERYNPHTMTRHDFFGFADVLAIIPPFKVPDVFCTKFYGCLAIQCCAQVDVQKHINNILIDDHDKRNMVIKWLRCSNRFEIWGWAKRSVRNEDGSFKCYKHGGRVPKKQQPKFYRITWEDDQLWTYEDETETVEDPRKNPLN